ncbi:hypothetical protein GWI33_016587 [Rhynchophorus ferrugineus]|uniref:Uncharacterized protein n=1 Tax=Rhynchophorus ferrugineus TaxID=354439 RepID=A0A834HX30_RHYFE|nr:hypothetical protein GWI33_016587 [Rhynchophorus ferrugineus]
MSRLFYASLCKILYYSSLPEEFVGGENVTGRLGHSIWIGVNGERSKKRVTRAFVVKGRPGLKTNRPHRPAIELERGRKTRKACESGGRAADQGRRVAALAPRAHIFGYTTYTIVGTFSPSTYDRLE